MGCVHTAALFTIEPAPEGEGNYMVRCYYCEAIGKVSAADPSSFDPERVCWPDSPELDLVELEQLVADIMDDYAEDVFEHARDATLDRVHASRRAALRQISLAFQGRRPYPKEGDEIVTLLGDNDCDENDQPRQAPPGTRGRVGDYAGDNAYNVIFDTGVWVILDLHEICDPQQYKWSPK